MQAQSSHRLPDGLHVASGYGLKVYVDRGHLIVHQGVGRQRETHRFNRATSGLERLVVIGQTGFVTLDALRWLQEVDASLIQIGPDSEVVAATVAERFHNTKLRRAQVLAASTDLGVRAMRELLIAKLERQRLQPGLPSTPHADPSSAKRRPRRCPR